MDSIREKYPHFKTREWEATIPAFNSHGEAVAWFKNNFGKDFEFAGTDIINGEKCYIYHLIGTVCNLSFLNKVVVQLNEPKCKSPSRKKPPESGGRDGGISHQEKQQPIKKEHMTQVKQGISPCPTGDMKDHFLIFKRLC